MSQLTEEIKNLSLLLNQLEKDCNCEEVKLKVKQYCDQLDSQINNNIEEKIKKLHSIREEIFNEIDDYKSERYKSIENDAGMEKIRSCLNQTAKKIEQLKDKFQSGASSIKKDETASLRNTLNNFERNLVLKSNEINEKLFGKKKLVLQFGYTHTGANESSVHYCLDANIRRFHIDSVTTTVGKEVKIATENEVVLNYVVDDAEADRLVIYCFSKSLESTEKLGSLIKNVYSLESNQLEETAKTQHFYKDRNNCHMSLFYKQFIFCGNIEDTSGKTNVDVYDQDLHLLKIARFNGNVTHMATDEKKLYLVCALSPFVHVFAENFIPIFTYGQNASIISPYYLRPSHNCQYSFKDACLFMRQTSALDILNEKTGTVAETRWSNVRNKFDYFKAVSTSEILVADYKQKSIELYDLNFELIKKVSFEERLPIEEISSIDLTTSMHLVVLSSNKIILF